MSKVAIRVVRDSKHVGTVSRQKIADAIRTVGRDAKTGTFIPVKQQRNGGNLPVKR